MKNQETIIEIASTHLGKVGGAGYKDTYDPGLLVAIPRSYNRQAYGIDEANLPFVGGDVWNAYEVSAITGKGLPVVGMLKIYYPCDSEYHVESKSIKLYLNSFNMTPLGETSRDCVKFIEETVAKDLSEALKTEVQCKMHLNDYTKSYEIIKFPRLGALINLDSIEFTAFKSDASQLSVSRESEEPVITRLVSDLLRSNCRVTNQPDWGDIYIHIKSHKVPDLYSIAKYIVSHRQVSHFHEEICEMVYKHLELAYNPQELLVACLYTRRGGLDINPIRASHAELIFPEFIDVTKLNKKTLRQ